MTIVYQTDAEGYFVGLVKADPDPLQDGQWLIPGGCVTISPPVLSANEAAKWNGLTWVKVPDFRGNKYWLADGSQHEITERGISVPPDALPARPPKTPAQIEAEESDQAKRELAALDIASIPLLRAYIASKADAPQELKDIEAAAALKKLKIK